MRSIRLWGKLCSALEDQGILTDKFTYELRVNVILMYLEVQCARLGSKSISCLKYFNVLVQQQCVHVLSPLLYVYAAVFKLRKNTFWSYFCSLVYSI